MCGRVIQSSKPLAFAIVDGMNVRHSRSRNHPPRWNAAPSQELLVIRRNHKTGEVSLDPLRWGFRLLFHHCRDKVSNYRFRTFGLVCDRKHISTRKLSRAPRPPHRFSFLRSSRVSSGRSSGIQNTRSRIGPGRRPICERSLARQDEAGRLRT